MQLEYLDGRKCKEINTDCFIFIKKINNLVFFRIGQTGIEKDELL